MGNLRNFDINEFQRTAEPSSLLLDIHRKLESETELIDYTELKQAQDESYLRHRIVGS